MKNKKGLNIIRRIPAGLLLGLYVLVALLNSSVVQSYLGAAAGNYFSKEWGGKVRIGALHFNPWSHIVLNKIELISPTNDTIYYGDRISCRFKHFPFHKGGLKMDRVYLRNGRYHFESLRRPDGHMGTNLDFIISHYPPPERTSHEIPHYIVEVGELRMRNIDYIQDLPEIPGIPKYEHGVDIAHMRYLHTSGLIRDVRVDNDSVTCRVISLTTTEASGMHVVDLSMEVEVSPNVIHATNLDLQTDDSRLFLDALLTYHGWDEMNDYCNTVWHDVVIKPGTEANLCEAAYWAPVLWGLNEKIAIQGHFYGPVSDMHARQVVARFGEGSHFFLDAEVRGLPFIEQTYFDVDIHRLHATCDDLAEIRLPEQAAFTLPAIAQRLAFVDLDGTLKGSHRDCETFFNINTHIGDLEGHAHITYDSTRRDYTYIGDLDSRTLGIKSVVPNEWVSRTGFHLSFQGTGFDPQTMEAALEGRLYKTQFKGHSLNRTTLSAELTGRELSADIQLQDSLIGLDLSATADLAQKSYSADLFLTDARLAALDLIKSDSDIVFSTHLTADIQGEELDNATGSLTLHNSHGRIGSRRLDMERLELTATSTNQYKRVMLGSDWIVATLRGYFQYTDLPLVARDFCDRYLPTYYNPFRNADSADLTPLYDDNFSIDMSWNDERQTFGRLIPEIHIAKGSKFQGSYNYGENIKMGLRSDTLAYNGLALHDIVFISNAKGDSYEFNIKAAGLAAGVTPLLENIDLTTHMGTNISTLSLQWDDDLQTSNTEGEIGLFLHSTPTDNKLMLTRSSLLVVGQQWSLVCPHGILVNRERLLVEGLKVYGLGQSVSVQANIAGSEEDILRAAFDDFSLKHLSSTLLHNNSLTVDGTIDGTLDMKGFGQKPYIDANLTVDNCVANNQPLGRLDISSNYRTEEGRLYLNLSSDLNDGTHHRQPVSLQGYASLNDNIDDMDFDIEADHLSLKMAQPLLTEVASNIGGSLSGTLRLHGSRQVPLIDGSIAIEEGTISLTPTGATYRFGDSLGINSSSILFDNFAVRDLQDNFALIDGDITVTGHGLILDLALHTDGLTLFDKSDVTQEVYGKLFATLHGTVSGPANKLVVSANATALEGSELYVPISNRREVNENEYITFTSHNTTQQPYRPTTRTAPSSDIDLTLNVAITPGMKLHLPMDFQQLEANVTAIGNGDIKVSMQGGQQPLVLGDYKFTSGDFSLSLMQIIGKTFSIEQGSTLNFPGDINDARFNINAVCNVRANLASLMGSNVSDNYITVQDVITLAGTLNDPAIRFDIRLPNVEQNVQDQVFSYIDRKNELEMLNQSISLLLMGQFASTGNSNANDPSEGIDGLGLLTSSIGSIVTGMVKVVDVNFKYQAATATTTGQWDVGISKKWNKLYFESSFGYGNNSDLDATMANVLVGDVEMGYRFTPFFNFYGFHRTNTSYFTRNELPNKQGIGVKLTRDFDNLYDLFPWLKHADTVQNRK